MDEVKDSEMFFHLLQQHHRTSGLYMALLIEQLNLRQPSVCEQTVCVTLMSVNFNSYMCWGLIVWYLYGQECVLYSGQKTWMHLNKYRWSEEWYVTYYNFTNVLIGNVHVNGHN